MQLQENTLFAKRYRLIRLLGRGGFSEVWLAEDKKTTLEVAVKIYAPGTGLDDDGIATFTEEFALVFNLNHTHLLKPTHFDDEDRMPYLILPYCKFGSTSKMIGYTAEDTAWNFLHDVASGLSYLHSLENPVIHQDIKPDNIMMDENNKFLITDFGISTKVRHTLRQSISLVSSGGNGTRAYMGPERFSREPMAIKASDIWALGATLYELTEGDTPFGELGGLNQRSGAEIPYMKGNWSEDLKTIVFLCLHAEPWDRPTAEKIVEWTEGHIKKGLRCNFSNFNMENDSNNYRSVSGDNKEIKKPKVNSKIIGSFSVIILFSILGILFTYKYKTKPEPEPNPHGNQVNTEQQTSIIYVKDKDYDLLGKKFIYTGETSNGLPDGKGTAKYTVKVKGEVSEGSIYEGNFSGGYREGKGHLQNPSGSSYEGEYFHDKANGHGKYTFSDGDYYEGDFVNNMFHGTGAEYDASGNIKKQGIYKNDEYIGKQK